MDSLTQIVLGAAVGEAVLGRKVGNRAMLWGGIAGTIPDLDVFANMASDPLSSLAYHRAFTHSFAFGVLASPILGYLIHRLYGGADGPLSNRPFYQAFLVAGLSFFVLLAVGSYLMPIEILGIGRIAAVVALATFVLIALVALRESWRTQLSANGNASAVAWSWLFFGAIVTHPLLDCFTAYGTQFLEPFSAWRISWHSISVVDPLYTLPFLILLIAAARRLKGSQGRKRLNQAALWLSSAYLFYTVINHHRVEAVLESSLQAQRIEASRYIVTPTIFNNILWQGIVQGRGDDYYFGRYSLLDEPSAFDAMLPIAGRHDLLKNYQNTRELRILNWFTDGYISYLPLDSGRVQVNDLRFGLLGSVDPSSPSQYVFNWVIDTSRQPIELLQGQRPGEDGDMSAAFGGLWERLKGR